jgi:hypothetical protein
MWRAQYRQIKHAGQFDVVYIAPSAVEELVILTPAERPADIGRRLHCFGHWITRQKVSTQGRSSTSKDQALRGCRSTST